MLPLVGGVNTNWNKDNRKMKNILEKPNLSQVQWETPAVLLL